MYWPPDLSIPSSHSGVQRSSRSARPLKAVSGNRQPFALDSHGGPKSQNAHDVYYLDALFSQTKPLSNPFSTNASVPCSDPGPAIRCLHQRQPSRRRQHGSSTGPKYQDRSYLDTEHYQEYRARQRKDVGPDNKQVWSDDVEEAFQEALVEIEPMGRGRRVQNGKELGRNELIAEYIYRKTGERRTRKQVSSHIQVLNALLGDNTSWQWVTKARHGAEAPSANGGCYDNSITHKVARRHRRISDQRSSHREDGYARDPDKLPPPSQTLGSNAFTATGKRISGVHFEMWMSPNQSNMDKRLHDFTSLQSARDLPRCDPSPLEDVRDWRSLYPCLAASLDGQDDDMAKVDIIMIETSYKLMSEFPPPKATLGLRLELDLGPKSREELFDWTCTTHIYRNGVAAKEASYYRLEAKWGVVAPPFDSMWWALTFIDKVEQKKDGEETGKGDGGHASQERAHQFFSQLTAVHEIRARSRAGGVSPDRRSERGLVAVLLWKFSVAPETYVGTTSWQRLLPPPAHVTIHSPRPMQEELCLPPLAIDTIIDGLHHPTGMGDGADLLNGPPPDANYEEYPAGGLHDPNALLDHHDFEMTFKDEDMANFASSMQPSFMLPGQQEHEGQSFHQLAGFDYGIQLDGLPTPSRHDTYQPSSNNMFEAQHANQNALAEQYPKASQSHVYGLHRELDHDVGGTRQRRPLDNFDHTTHKILQAQLAEAESQQSKEEDVERLKSALAAASAITDLGNGRAILTDEQACETAAKSDHLSAGWEEVTLQPAQLPTTTQTSFTSHASSYTLLDEHQLSVGPAANSNVFEANHRVVAAAVDLHGHDAYNPSTSSPELRRLLEMHNHHHHSSFVEDDHQTYHLSDTAKHDFDASLCGSFVMVEPHHPHA